MIECSDNYFAETIVGATITNVMQNKKADEGFIIICSKGGVSRSIEVGFSSCEGYIILNNGRATKDD